MKNIVLPIYSGEHEVTVCLQNPTKAPYTFDLPNTRLIELNNVGVTKSRNAVLNSCRSKYLIFGDDDVTFIEDGIRQVLNYFENHDECVMILARTIDEFGVLRKNYKNQITPLRLTNSARAATYEMIIRVDAIKDAGVKFDENFGAGVENYLGDEFIFIADALRVGLVGIHLPVIVAMHPKQSSGSLWGTEIDLAVRAKVFTRVFGMIAPVLRLLFLLKTKNKKPSMVQCIKFIFDK